MSVLTTGYKALTHDLRPPIQGGEPVFDGTCPFTLPAVVVDTSNAECSNGWNFCATIDDALAIAGFWPNGRPSRVFAVEDAQGAVERGRKRRCTSGTLAREVTEEEVAEAIRRLSGRWFLQHAEAMAAEQLAWRAALARPRHDAGAVEAGLREALAARGLTWKLRRYESARAARDAWAARDARDAWAARDALTVQYAARQEWITKPADLLTRGLRDAYTAGLAIALATAKGTLGWAMDEVEAQP